MSKEFQIRDGNLIASFDLENEDGDIDFCKLLKVSHGLADEIGMFVDYVATNKIIKDQSKQIADLEAKLAEKEKEYNIKYKHWIEEIRESDRLREELAKTNKEWVQSIHDWKELCKKKDQDKISFAVEQLEKAKEKALHFYVNDTPKLTGYYIDVNEIDNQIKQLKEGK